MSVSRFPLSARGVSMRRFATVLPRAILIAALASMAACAGPGARPAADPVADLEQRATARWDLLLARKPAEAWAYLTPGYRATRPVAEYRGAPANPNLTWKGVTWRGADCDRPDSCQARLLLDYELTAPQAGKVPGIQEITERWLRLDGVWYHLPAQ